LNTVIPYFDPQQIKPLTDKPNMSHFTTIKTQIKDIDALRAALREMGLALFPNADARGYSSNQTHGDFVIRLNGPYDIALTKQSDNSYGLITDWWSGHVEKEVGKNFGRLLQLYGIHKTMQEARKKGFSALRKTQADGSIKLILSSL
jgi:hypothetical protein